MLSTTWTKERTIYSLGQRDDQLSIDSIPILAQPDSLRSKRKINAAKLPVGDLREPNHLIPEEKDFVTKT